jgi:hypothetical protein
MSILAGLLQSTSDSPGKSPANAPAAGDVRQRPAEDRPDDLRLVTAATAGRSGPGGRQPSSRNTM